MLCLSLSILSWARLLRHRHWQQATSDDALSPQMKLLCLADRVFVFDVKWRAGEPRALWMVSIRRLQLRQPTFLVHVDFGEH
jgi:hypothetical protein